MYLENREQMKHKSQTFQPFLRGAARGGGKKRRERRAKEEIRIVRRGELRDPLIYQCGDDNKTDYTTLNVHI